MTIEGSAAYLHARYEKGSRFENQLVGGELVEVDRSGEPITQAPKWTASIGAPQEFEFEAGILKLHADYAYIARRYFNSFTTGDPDQEEEFAIANEASLVKGSGLVNAQVCVTLCDPAIEFPVLRK